MNYSQVETAGITPGLNHIPWTMSGTKEVDKLGLFIQSLEMIKDEVDEDQVLTRPTVRSRFLISVRLSFFVIPLSATHHSAVQAMMTAGFFIYFFYLCRILYAMPPSPMHLSCTRTCC